MSESSRSSSPSRSGQTDISPLDDSISTPSDRLHHLLSRSTNLIALEDLPSDHGTRSGMERAAVLNLGNQSNTLDTDTAGGIALENIRSSDEIRSKPMIVTAEIHEPHKGIEKEPRSLQNKPISLEKVGTTSGVQIPSSSLEIHLDPKNLPEIQQARPELDQNQPKRPQPTRAQNTFHSNRSRLPLALKIYLKYESLFWLIVFTSTCAFVFPIKFERSRTQETGLPSYSYNLVRPICIDGKDYSNCLRQQKNRTKYLTMDFIHNNCIHNMTRTFINEYCPKNLTLRSLDRRPVHGMLNGSIFFYMLTGSNDTTIEENVLKYLTCVRVFKKNPFGEVGIIPKLDKTNEVIRFDFILKNYKLMTECGIISPDSLIEYFYNSKRVYDFVKWVFGMATAAVWVSRLIRFCNKNDLQLPKWRQPAVFQIPTTFSNRF